MKLVRPGIVLTSLALAIAVPLGAGAAASSSGVHTFGTITGVVDDNAGHPLAQICVALRDTAGNWIDQATTAADGSYGIIGLDAGSYFLTYQDCNRSTGPNVLPQYYDNAQVFSSHQAVTLNTGETKALDTQTMQPGAQVSLHLVDSHGAPVQNVVVAMESQYTPIFLPSFDSAARSDTNGSLTFVGLYPITYTLQYQWCPQNSCATIGYYKGQASTGSPTTVLPVIGSPLALNDVVNVPPVLVSQTNVGVSPATSTFGQTVTMTATVTLSDGSTPVGYVAFDDGAVNLAQSSVGPIGPSGFTATTTSLPLGESNIIAYFVPTAGDVTQSSGGHLVQVNAAPAGGSGGTGSGGTGSGGVGSSGAGSGGGGAAAPVAAAVAPVARLAGTNRIATAVAVSQNSFPAGNAGAVVLARADDYPDALVGGPLAAARNAPLLLTEDATLPAATATEIKRVLPAGGTVYVLGGTSAVPTSVANQLTSFGYQVVRYSGADRYATAVVVATALGSPTTVLLATGTNFPDALAAGPAAAHVHGAILLTDGSTVPAETATYLAGAHVTYAIGGPAAAAVPSATAILGSDRYATAAAVATKFFPSSAIVGVATGTGFPDALAGGAQLALMGGPLLLSSAASVPAPTSGYLTVDHSALTKIYVYGGTSVLSANVVAQLTAAFGG